MKVDELIDDIDVEEESTPDNTFYYGMDGSLKDTDFIQDPPDINSGCLSAHFTRERGLCGRRELYWILTTGGVW